MAKGGGIGKAEGGVLLASIVANIYQWIDRLSVGAERDRLRQSVSDLEEIVKERDRAIRAKDVRIKELEDAEGLLIKQIESTRKADGKR